MVKTSCTKYVNSNYYIMDKQQTDRVLYDTTEHLAIVKHNIIICFNLSNF